MAKKKITENAGKYVNFPSNSESNEVKNSFEFGKQVSIAIEGEWFRKESNTAKFYVNRQRYHSLRLYGLGDQDIRRYKDEFSLNGDLSYLNLDFTPVPIIPKFVDIVVNGMQDRNFTVKATSVDPIATAERKEYIETLRAEVANYEDLAALSEATGQDVFKNDADKMPRDKEELDLHLQLDYKQAVELAIEHAVDYEFKINEFNNIKYRFDYDLMTIGIGAVKHQFIPGEGIRIEYIDPANVVYNYTESKYYDDCYYFGEVKRVHITEIQKQFPNLGSDAIKSLEDFGMESSKDYNQIPYNTDDEDTGFLDVLYFCYKTIHNEIFKIRDTNAGTQKALLRDEGFQPPADKRAGFDKTHRHDEVIYEGVKILGRDLLLKWDLQKNMIRPSLSSPKVIMPYIIASPKQYKGKIYSLVKRMEKYADQIQLIHLKIQQVIQKMTPSGIFLDVDGLAEIDLGNGTSYNPQEALQMYFETGSVLGRSSTDEGEFNHGKIPIQELPGSGGQQIGVLLQSMEYNIQQIRNVTGLNEARDGSLPDPKALVGVQKLAAANSNVATRHLLKASHYITTRLAEGIALRISDVLEYAPDKDDYINAIGQSNVEILDDLKDLSIHEFGIFIELGPDEEEKGLLEQNIQAAIAKNELKIEDAIDIRRIPNPKLANQYLKLQRKKRDAESEALAQRNSQAQAQAQADASTQVEQAKMQSAQILSQSEIQVDTNKANLSIQHLTAEKEGEKELLLFKHQLQLDLMGIQQSHENAQNDKKIDGDMKKEKAKGGGSSDISVESKANTLDGNLKTGGLLQG